MPLLAVALIAGGCWSSDKQQPMPEQGQAPQGQAAQGGQDTPSGKQSFKNSLKDLMGMGSSLKCTWDKQEEDSKIKGTVYITGNKFMQDMQISDMSGQDGKPYTFNALSDGEWFYSWNTMMPGSGMKFKLSELEAQSGEASDTVEKADSPADLQEELDFECEPWSGNGDFTPPANMEFKDNTQMLKNAQNSAAKGIDANDPCAACGMMPSEQLRDMCLEQNNCK